MSRIAVVETKTESPDWAPSVAEAVMKVGSLEEMPVYCSNSAIAPGKFASVNPMVIWR